MGCGSSVSHYPIKDNILEDEPDGLAKQCEEQQVHIQNATSLADVEQRGPIEEREHRNIEESTEEKTLKLVIQAETKTLPLQANQGPAQETHVDSDTAKMESTIPAYNEECLQMAQQLVARHSDLKSGFEDIDAFVKALDDDPELKRNGELIRGLTSKVVSRSYVNKDETNRGILAEYMSYIKVAEAMFKTYSTFLKQNGLEFLTEAKVTKSLPYTDVKFVKEMRSILWNYTDASLLFGERVCNSGILKYFVDDMQAILDEAGGASSVVVTDNIFRSARGILHNCSNNPITRQTIRELGTVPVALAYLKDGNPVVKMTVLLILANIIDEEDNKVLIADGTVFTVILKMIQYAWDKPRHRCDGFSVAELTVGLTGLAKNDKNKKILTQKGAIPVLITILEEGSEEEREKAAQCVWELAFDKDNQKTFLENADLMHILDELKKSSNRKLAKVAEGALWAINLEKKEQQENKKRSIQEVNGKIQKGHIMISYQWADQKTLIKVKEYLKRQNFNVWMDIDNMEGSTLQAMAEAVQNAAVVLVCMSERYKLSQNCRSEAEYAFDIRKPIVPLLLQSEYKPDGWLGLIKGAKLYFDFSGKYPFDTKAADLVKELGERGKGIPASQDILDGGSNAVVKATPADAGRGSGSVKDWSKKDVHNWLCKLGLENQATLKSLTGKQLTFLRKVSYKAPEFFYGYIKTDLKLNDLEDLMNFSEAVENLQQ